MIPDFSFNMKTEINKKKSRDTQKRKHTNEKKRVKKIYRKKNVITGQNKDKKISRGEKMKGKKSEKEPKKQYN